MIETEGPKRGVKLTVDLGFYVELKKILFRNGISMNELLSYVIQAIVTGDPRAHQMLDEAKRARSQKEISDIVHTDDESLYNIIEERLHNKKE